MLCPRFLHLLVSWVICIGELGLRSHGSDQRLNGNLTYHGCDDPAIRTICADFKLSGPPVSAGSLWGPDCKQLRKRLQCTIFLINCPHRGQSQQLFDIPCQSSCFAAYEVCTNRLGISHQSDPVASSRARSRGRGGRGASSGDWYNWGNRHSDWQNFRFEDCRLLPTGVCDEWAEYMSTTHYLNITRIKASVQENEGCPSDNGACRKMFPPKIMKRSQFLARNFTDIMQVTFSQTIWLITRSSFQPYFRLNIHATHRTSVHTAQQTMHIHSWPLACPCTDWVVVNDRKYLMLTKSVWPRGALVITKDTVFLPRNRRNRRKINCWVKRICPKRRRKQKKRALRRQPSRRRRFQKYNSNNNNAG